MFAMVRKPHDGVEGVSERFDGSLVKVLCMPQATSNEQQGCTCSAFVNITVSLFSLTLSAFLSGHLLMQS